MRWIRISMGYGGKMKSCSRRTCLGTLRKSPSGLHGRDIDLLLKKYVRRTLRGSVNLTMSRSQRMELSKSVQKMIDRTTPLVSATRNMRNGRWDPRISSFATCIYLKREISATVPKSGNREHEDYQV